MVCSPFKNSLMRGVMNLYAKHLSFFLFFFRASVLDYEIPEVELEDGSLQSVLEVSLPNGQTIQPCCMNDDKGEPYVIPCTVTFKSSSPVSFTANIIFTDGKEKYDNNFFFLRCFMYC